MRESRLMVASFLGCKWGALPICTYLIGLLQGLSES